MKAGMVSTVRMDRAGLGRLGFTVVSAVTAPPPAVWQHAVTPGGVNHELAPFLHMSFPDGIEDLSASGVPLGERLFRSRIRLLGVVPVEWDDVTFVEIEPGRRFLERSPLLTQRSWEHERVVTADGPGSRLTDRIAFEPRATSLGSFHWAAFRAVFAWRHRRFRRRFGSRPLGFRVETERLLVRPWRPDEVGVLARLGHAPPLVRFIGDGRPWDEGRAETFVSRQSRILRQWGFCLGAIEERASGAVVGLSGLQPLGATGEAEVGWWLDPTRWGRGYATEIAGAVLRFGFEVAALRRVVAVADPQNERSIRVMERLGMRPQGATTSAEVGLGRRDAPVAIYAAEQERRLDGPITLH
jgi:RimJ/RimL family protein N-acetyltransferase